MAIGENSRDADASAADGTRPADAVYLIRCGGRHTALLRAAAGGAVHILTFISYGSGAFYALDRPRGSACQRLPKPIAMARAASGPGRRDISLVRRTKRP